MSKKTAKKRDTKFKAGNRAAVGKGRPRLSPEAKALRQVTKTKVKEMFDRLSHMNKQDMTEFVKRDDVHRRVGAFG